ncbi:hypothetical protein DPMN_082211 [Dreissena polymorpha]|uniref:Uncharacterized protein n=1 Tax=Dreissena polymorpha TaxID=45954 RepID=A0A9D3YAF1_DREPO|nr:hypothetical protein DPMN_082211 [Dreissena polymorpha]
MTDEALFARVLRLAVLALVRFLPAVDALVTSQVTTRQEALVTYLADDLQTLRLNEYFFANNENK